MTRRVWRTSLVSITSALLVALGLLGFGVATNNLARRPPSEPELRRALDRAITWLVANRARIEADPNPALWWMLASANNELDGDSRLTSLVSEYRNQMQSASFSRSPWRMLFDGPEAAPYNLANQLVGMPGYNVFFLYGLSCSAQLAQLSEVQDELVGNFCPSIWVLTPHCATHQLMGLLWGLQNRCDGTSPKVGLEVISSIRRQLVFDFRVDDAYIQRTLMLARSNDWRFTLKPVWIDRTIDAQLEDGGWDSAARLFRLTASKYVVIGDKGIAIREPTSSFHTTAQGLWLMAHLLSQHADQSTGLAMWYRFPSAR